MMKYILYKKPLQLDTLAIVQYAYFLGFDIRPDVCIERNYPKEISELPAILCLENNKYYCGIEEITTYYSNKIKINNLLEKALKWKEQNPEYRIHN